MEAHAVLMLQLPHRCIIYLIVSRTTGRLLGYNSFQEEIRGVHLHLNECVSWLQLIYNKNMQKIQLQQLSVGEKGRSRDYTNN